MPRKSRGGAYPPDWPEIAFRVKVEAGWQCVRCGRHQTAVPGYFLTVHHLDMNPANLAWWNLLCLCCPCHLSVQARVDLARPWIMLPHSPWFQPFVAGWYAHHYAGLDLSRAEVMARLPELLALEAQHILQGAP